MSRYSRDQRLGGGTPPPFIAAVHQIKCLPLGVRKMTSRPALRNHLKSSRRELQGWSPPIESYEAPQGRLRGARRGFSPSGFPLQVADFGLPHHPSIHTHRRWGNIGSRGTTADRDRQEGVIAEVSKRSTEGRLARARAALPRLV